MSETQIPDPEALAARLRAREPEAVGEAYRRLFASEIGRFVLAHILAVSGMAQVRGDEMSGRARAYHDGRIATALGIMTLAGFDANSAAVTTLDASDFMEGRDYERDQHGGHVDHSDNGRHIVDDDG